MGGGAIWLTVYKSIIGETKAGTQGKNLEAGTETKAIGERSLVGCSVCFLIQLRTTCSGVAPPTIGLALLHHPLRKCPTEVPKEQSDGGIFSIEISSS